MATSIDPKSLRVVDLKEELGKRNLSKTGKKDELVARLTEALAAETETAAPAPEQPETTVPKSAAAAEAEATTTATITEDIPVSAAIQETEPSTKQTIMPPATDDTQQNELVTNIEEQAQMNDVVEAQPIDTSVPAETVIEETTTTAAVTSNSKPSEDSTIVSSSTTTISSATKEDQSQPLKTALPPAQTTNADMKTDDQQVASKRKREEPVEADQDKRTRTESIQTTTTEIKEPSAAAPVQAAGEQNAVCIKGFVRPLITKHLQEFIKQYGDVKRFWIDPIKTHCYIIYETSNQATNAFQSINGTVYPPTNTGKEVTVLRLTSAQASQLMDREQQVADHHGRVNWEKLLEKILNNETIEEPTAADHSPTTSKRRLGGLEQITRQLQQRGAVSAIMDQEQQKQRQPAPSILDRLSTSTDTNLTIPVPAAETQVTIAGVSRMADGKSLDDLFLKTKANPPLYYLPVDKDIVAHRLEVLKNKVE